jgi:50S ribosomal subunit-associated GTPase HflX
LKKCTIIGKTNVGKTLFLINFAGYLGLKFLDISLCDDKKILKKYKLSINQAIYELVNDQTHKTRCLQSIIVDVPMGKGKKKLQLIDTVGLIDGIHSNIEIRKAISHTLTIVRVSDIILHIVDAASAGRDELPSSMGEVDYQLAQFAQLKRGYAILANKMDLPDAKEGLDKIKSEFSGNLIIPISALHKKGFKEVRTFVAHNI